MPGLDCALRDKLEWEIDQLKDPATVRPRPAIFHAQNAAAPAWHLCDWVFNDMTPEQRKATGMTSLSALQTHARSTRALRICREICTAGKHWEVTEFPDPAIRTRALNQAHA